MRILITGSNGFVGGSLAKFLGQSHYIYGVGTKDISAVPVDKYIKWDMALSEWPLDEFDAGIDVIVHAGACLNMDNMCEQLIHTNCVGTHRVFQLAREKKVKKVFYISSIPVIGTPKEHPITEGHPVEPQTMYHVTKLTGELILNQLLQDNIEVVNLRVPSPIGPGMKEKTILPIFIRQALAGEKITLLGKGSRRQNYLDVRDLGALIENCLTLENISGIFNIGAIETISNKELALLCVKTVGSKSEICHLGDDALDNQIWDVDSTKARDVLGFEQKYTIQDSINDIIVTLKE